MLCTELTKVVNKKTHIVAEPLYCKRWSCEICAPKRQNQLRAIAKSGHPTTFLTLTVNPAVGTSPHDRAQRLVKAWRNIRQELKRSGRAAHVAFIAVFEKTKRGEPHLHILARMPFVQQSWISAYMKKYMDAPIVDIRAIRSAKMVAAYVAKYISKDTAAFEKCKRYWQSRDYQLEKRERPSNLPEIIAILKRSYDLVLEDWKLGGVTTAEDVRRRSVRIGWWTSDWVIRG